MTEVPILIRTNLFSMGWWQCGGSIFVCVRVCACVPYICIDSNNCPVDSFVRVDRRGGVGVAT